MADPVRDFKITDDGEWYTANGDFATVAGADAVRQGIRIRVGMFLGECYLDEAIGVDYINVVLVKNADPLVVRAEIQREIADTPDVTNVIGAQVDIDGATREGSVSYEVDTVYSEQPFSDTIEVP
jgi:hypothetical protein